MPKNRGRQTPALYQDMGGEARSSSSDMHRRLRESATARGMTVEIHEDGAGSLLGKHRDASLAEMLAGLTMKEVVMLSLIFILFLKFTLVPWINVVGSEAWASAKQGVAGGRGINAPSQSCAPNAAPNAAPQSVSVVILGAGGVGQGQHRQ